MMQSTIHDLLLTIAATFAMLVVLTGSLLIVLTVGILGGTTLVAVQDLRRGTRRLQVAARNRLFRRSERKAESGTAGAAQPRALATFRAVATRKVAPPTADR